MGNDCYVFSFSYLIFGWMFPLNASVETPNDFFSDSLWHTIFLLCSIAPSRQLQIQRRKLYCEVHNPFHSGIMIQPYLNTCSKTPSRISIIQNTKICFLHQINPAFPFKDIFLSLHPILIEMMSKLFMISEGDVFFGPNLVCPFCKQRTLHFKI